jgi:hypothetical protein
MIAVMKQSERSRIDSDLLQTFLVVAEARNLTRAADRLGRTQKLEDVLSAKLFRREARGMTLTEVSGDVRKSSLDDTRKEPPDDVAGVKDGRHGDNFSFL